MKVWYAEELERTVYVLDNFTEGLSSLELYLWCDSASVQTRLELKVDIIFDAAYYDGLTRFAAVDAGILDDGNRKTAIALCEACAGRSPNGMTSILRHPIHNSRKPKCYNYRTRENVRKWFFNSKVIICY